MLRKNLKNKITKITTLTLIMGLISASMPSDISDAKRSKPSLKKNKITMIVGETKKVNVKKKGSKIRRKVKIKLTESQKEIVKISARKKHSFKVTGKKAGRVTLRVNIYYGKKKKIIRKLKVVVNMSTKEVDDTDNIAVTCTPMPDATKTPTVTAAITTCPDVATTLEATGTPEITSAATNIPEVTMTTSATNTPEATATVAATSTPKATATLAVTNTPEATATVIATNTPEVTATVAATSTPKATATVAATNTPEATATVAVTNTPEVTATVAVTNTPEVTATVVATSTPDESSQDTSDYVYSEDFENGLGNWYARYNPSTNVAELSISSEAYDGECAMVITGRERTWNSPGIDMTDTLVSGGTYKVSFYAKVPDNDEAYDYTDGLPLRVSAAYQTTADATEEYANYPANTDHMIYQDEWTLVETEFTLPSTIYSYVIYVETNGKSNASYLIDDITITEISLPGQYDSTLDSIKDTYADFISSMGVATTYADLLDENTLGFINHHFNSITMGNDMKMDAIMGVDTLAIADDVTNTYVVSDEYIADPDNWDPAGNVIVPKIDFTEMDAVLKIAKENNLKVRLHSPFWHQQNPQQFFTVGFETGDDVQYTSEENMFAREEMYVRTLLEHIFNSGYGDVIISYDVVNEYTHMANEGDTYVNYWKYIFGEEMETDCVYVKKAYAVAYDELLKNDRTDISLIYNDYNTYDEVDTIIELINNINAKDDTYNPNGYTLCDGIGMQSHINDTSTTAEVYQKAIHAFAEAGFEIQITELDVTSTGTVDNDTSDEEKESVWEANATLYGEIMTAILTEKVAGANITSVTIWGTTDATSWRSTKAPLLFGENLADKKPSFDAFINAAKEFSVSD